MRLRRPIPVVALIRFPVRYEFWPCLPTTENTRVKEMKFNPANSAIDSRITIWLRQAARSLKQAKTVSCRRRSRQLVGRVEAQQATTPRRKKVSAKP